VCTWQIKFLAAVEADLVGAAFDREHTAEVTMSTPEKKLEDTGE